MIQADRDLLARLTRLNTRIAEFHVGMGEVVLRLLTTWQQDGELDAGDLRAVSRGLVLLGGEATGVGVAMAMRAIEIDQTAQTDDTSPAERPGGDDACSPS